MNCTACSHENPDSARFCNGCGAKLEATCPSCGAHNPPGARFCNGCGQGFADAGRAGARPSQTNAPEPRSYTPKHLADKILASKSALEGERKQVTVLFADVKGSMDLAEQVDPEAWHKILNRFFEILTDGVHRFEGTVNQYTGDGIMALFGAPITHEDHAQRTCYAALHLQKELQQYSEELKRTQGLNFAARMGINSGEVVVGKIGDDLRMDYTAQGHTVGLAARLEQLADPGKIYVSEHTAKLVGGFFRLRDLGPFDLKGVRGQIHVHELQDVGELRTRLDMSRARGLSPFVGRQEEMEVLERALARSLEGNAQVVGIVADAGLGKSRLCYEFIEKCRARNMNVNQAQGVPHGKAIPFYPVLQMLRDYFGITDQDADKKVREKVAGKLLLLDAEFRETLPLLFDFLGVPDPGLPTSHVDPEARQRQLFGVMRRLIHVESAREPGVILAEDLHWVDGGSEAFLENLIEALPGTRGLLIVNFRPEYHAAWMKKSYYQQLPIHPLGASEITELLKKILGDDRSLAGLAERITQRTSGNPYFIEEVVQSLVEARVLVGAKGAYRLAGSVDQVAIPATVQAVLSARIDRLAEREKQLLQAASVIGREFPEPVLRHVANLAEGDLAEALRMLVGAEFTYEASIYPDLSYAFKHALTQEVVYNSQLSDRRARVHAAVAKAISELHADKLDERAALLAHHWEKAGDHVQAALCHARAAEWAGVRDSAEALRHWREVITLLEGVPESGETIGLGLMARLRFLGMAWRQGVTEDEAGRIFAEGEALATRTGNPYLSALLKFSGIGFQALAGDCKGALDRMPEIERLSEQTGDAGLRLAIDSVTSWLLLMVGRLEEALALADRVIEAPPENLKLGADVTGYSPYIQTLQSRAAILTYLARYEESLRDLERTIALAQAHGEQEILGWARSNYALPEWCTGRDLAGLSHTRQGLESAEKSGSAMSRVLTRWGLGFAHLAREEWQEAREVLEGALSLARETRAGLFVQVFALAGQAEACLELGEGALARRAVDEALEILPRTTIGIVVPYVYLTQARVLLRTEGAKARKEIGVALDEAIRLARETGERCWVPFIHEERAALAKILGDAAGRQSALREAHRLHQEFGADKHAQRITRELGL